MDVPGLTALSILFLVPISMSAPIEVPVVQEFNKAMMNSYNTTDNNNIFTEDKEVVEALNVTSDTVVGYPKDSKDFFDDISNAQSDGTNLAATMVPFVILLFVIMLGIIAAICGCCFYLVKRINKERRKRKCNIEVRKDVVVVKDKEEDVDTTKSTTPTSQANDSSEDGVYSINITRKTEYVPHDRAYIV